MATMMGDAASALKRHAQQQLSPLEQMSVHGQGVLFRNQIAARLELPDLASLRVSGNRLWVVH